MNLPIPTKWKRTTDYKEITSSEFSLEPAVANPTAEVSVNLDPQSSLAELYALRDALYNMGWTESSFIEVPPPPLEFDPTSGNLRASCKQQLLLYYKQQTALLKKMQRAARIKEQKGLATLRRQYRERRRLQARSSPVRNIRNSLFCATDSQQLVEALNIFRTNAHNALPDMSVMNHQGWLPHDVKFIGRLPGFNRGVYMFIKRSRNGKKLFPVVAICSGRTPVLFLKEREMVKLKGCYTHFQQLAKKNFRKQIAA